MERININGTVFPCVIRTTPAVFQAEAGREWRGMTIEATSEAAKAAFVDGITYSREWDSSIGETETEIVSTDMSEYCLAADVVDHRDGTVTVYMGKKTQAEIYEETIDDLMLAALEVQ